MTFRIKIIFWGVLICGLLCSSPAFSQIPQALLQAGQWQNPGAAQTGTGTSPATTALQGQTPAAQVPYYPNMPSQTVSPVSPQQPGYGAAVPSAGQPSYRPPTPQEAAALSPIEQYVSGKISQTLSYDIKQFGYDLFQGTPPAVPAQGIGPQGYTPQGYVPQGTPYQGIVSPGGVPQGVPSQGGVPQGVLPQGGVPQGLPPQGGVQPGVPSQGGVQPGVPSQGYVPQGAASQGVPQQGGVPQGVPFQGYVPQGAVSQGIPIQGQPTQTVPAPTTFYPRNAALGTPFPNVPVGPDYVIAPGDEIKIAVWGSVEGSWSAMVDRDGNISVPKIGTIAVAGLSFQQLKEVLEKELSKYFKDFQLNVTMGTLRTMTVYVVGNAEAPGAYLISSVSTIINALMIAGGPSKAGTMRDIQLKRKGETIAHLDLYDFLISGDKTKDQRLLPEDVIFIPPIGPIVGVAGNVDRPAIYEMKGKTTLAESIKMAGGVTAAAYLQRVQVERVFETQTKIVVDVNFEKFKGKYDVPLQNGDIVKIFPIVPLVTNKVVLQGNVRRPGEYEWRPGMRAKDILPKGDDLLPDTFLDYALITRLVPPDNHQEYRSFDLGAVLFRSDAQNNVPLEPYDMVTVFNKWEMVPKEKVHIAGAVNKAGDFEFRPNMKLSDLLKLAGGLSKYAYGPKADLTRVTPMPTGPLTQQMTVNPGEAIAGNPEYDITLQGDDFLLVKAVPDWHLYRTVSVSGEVNFPGNYAMGKGEKLSSLLDRAGGFTDKAYPRGATFTRLSVGYTQQQQIADMVNRLQREVLAASSAQVAGSQSTEDAQIAVTQANQMQATGRMVINVEEAKRTKNSALDIDLEDGDTLNIPTNPQTVQVLGAVYNQSTLVFEPAKDYSYYIDRAGGFTTTADKGQIYIVKVDGSSIKPGKGMFWNTSAHQWESGSPSQIEPGDIVVVPVKVETIAWMRNLTNLSQILYQATLGGAVVWNIFK